jgi:UDP-N-acetylmuramoyl-tripeptide--D-alanyl-D-alanine ligase
MKSLFKHLVIKILQNQVRRLIENNDLVVVGITGSVGKTSTKYAIATILQQRFQVLSGEGNYNSEIGMPLSLFNEPPPTKIINVISWIKLLYRNERQIKNGIGYEVAVLEMGADKPGDIKNFMSYITPDYGVVTAVAPSHVEGFGSVDNILREKWTLAQHSKTALVNIDFDILRQQAEKYSNALGQLYTYSTTVEADFTAQIEPVNKNSKVRSFEVSANLVNTNYQLETQLLAKHSIVSIVPAVALANLMGLSPSQIKKGVSDIKSPPGRLRLYPGIKDSTLIDDTYNANSTSMMAALEFLDELATHRRVAVLGSINELGNLSPSQHELVGRAVPEYADYLITIGADAKDYLVPAAIETGLHESRIKTFTSPVDAGQWLRKLVQPHDTVLFKGSQGQIYTEEALKHIIINDDIVSNLVRQSPNWVKQKKQYFDDVKHIY